MCFWGSPLRSWRLNTSKKARGSGSRGCPDAFFALVLQSTQQGYPFLGNFFWISKRSSKSNYIRSGAETPMSLRQLARVILVAWTKVRRAWVISGSSEITLWVS